MSNRSLNRRIAAIEKVMEPRNDIFIVIVEKGETKEEAKMRVMRERGIDKIPEDWHSIILDLCHRN